MGIETASSDDVAPRRRQSHFSAPREHGGSEQDRRTNLLAELRVQLTSADGRRVYAKLVALLPLGVHASGLDQLDQRLDITDARDVFERYGFFREQCGGDDWERSILVAGRANRTGELGSAL